MAGSGASTRRAAPRAGGVARDWLRTAVLVASLLPLARLCWLGVAGGLGPNPVEFITRSTGIWALGLLCATLAVTPLRRLTGWHRLARVRRRLGVCSFLYAALHVAAWVWLDQWFDPVSMLRDIGKRPFVTAGFAAFVLLVPLAATSTDAAMRRLGRRWATLHRLVYAAAALAILHFWWERAAKNLLVEPMLYGALVALLLGWRVYARLGSSRSSA